MKVPLFHLGYTLDSGQVFRWTLRSGWWEGVVGDRSIRLRQEGDELITRGTRMRASSDSTFAWTMTWRRYTMRSPGTSA